MRAKEECREQVEAIRQTLCLWSKPPDPQLLGVPGFNPKYILYLRGLGEGAEAGRMAFRLSAADQLLRREIQKVFRELSLISLRVVLEEQGKECE